MADEWWGTPGVPWETARWGETPGHDSPSPPETAQEASPASESGAAPSEPAGEPTEARLTDDDALRLLVGFLKRLVVKL